MKELQSLGLDIKVLDKNKEEIELKQNFDDDDDDRLHDRRSSGASDWSHDDHGRLCIGR